MFLKHLNIEDSGCQVPYQWLQALGLAVLAAALILVLTLALYRQGDQHMSGLIILGVGSAMLTLSVFFYAIKLDPGDGAAFTFFFFGTVLQGVFS